MGQFFRSEEMDYVQLFIQSDNAHNVVEELGNLGKIEFKDLNPDVSHFRRSFANEIKIWDEMEKKVHFFEQQIKILEREVGAKLIHDVDDGLQLEILPHEVDLQHQFETLEKELVDNNVRLEQLTRELNRKTEHHQVLIKANEFFAEVSGYKHQAETMMEDENTLLNLPERRNSPDTVKIGFLTGVMPKDRFPLFERIAWRQTRGNMLLQKFDLALDLEAKDPVTGLQISKIVFAIAFQGETVANKLMRICQTFDANVYPCSEDAAQRQTDQMNVEANINELKQVLTRTQEFRLRTLAEIAPRISSSKLKVIREKAIYHTMNLFNYDVGRKCLIAEGWCPSSSRGEITSALMKACSDGISPVFNVVPTTDMPPTHFTTNKFTDAFHSIVEAYGVARYREVNPAVLTIITFPFLFGVMFGDIGHGLFLLLLGLSFIWKERVMSHQKLNEMVETLFKGRYLLLLMGLFSIYAGFMYNECFSIPIPLFPSNWAYKSGSQEAYRTDAADYPFGVDWRWKWTKK